MSFKDALKRIAKLEERTVTDRVVLICIENGKECRKSLWVHEATMMALTQDTAKLFGTVEASEPPYRIIGVESGDDDGFIQALFLGKEDIDPEEASRIIEV